MKVEPLLYGDRKVFTVSAFNRGVAAWLPRLPTIWVEGEVTEFRRQPAGRASSSRSRTRETAPASRPRCRAASSTGSGSTSRNGERVHVYGRPELYEPRRFRLRALSIERFGLGDHLAALERLKRSSPRRACSRRAQAPAAASPAADRARHRQRRRGEARRPHRDPDALPPAQRRRRRDVCPGPRGAAGDGRGAGELAAEPEVDVIVLARGGGSFEDLLPFSDERLVRAVAACPVPVVSAVGHEQDTPLCDLAADRARVDADRRGRLVVPDLTSSTRARPRPRRARRAERAARSSASAQRLAHAHDRLRRAPASACRAQAGALDQAARPAARAVPAATLDRGYAIVRAGDELVRSSAAVATGDHVDVELAEGALRSDGRDDVRGSREGARARSSSGSSAATPGSTRRSTLWERGEELYRFCAASSTRREGKIEELAKRVDAARPAV